jgi:CheY-like chemotaxis protein
MPVKILLADRSITIQKVVEMLFSGKEYEVVCVSDGDTALGEASRIVPDVILADVDLPRIDGYRFAGRLKETPALANVPVILMLSRDDVYDAGKGQLAGIVDNIAKPFESQDLIGKVKKALTGAPAGTLPSPATAAGFQKASPVAPQPPKTASPVPPPPSMPKKQQAVPSDIFDIIQEAPEQPALRATQTAPASPTQEQAEEETYEVEPEFEVEPEIESEQFASSAPIPGPTAVASDPFNTDQLFGQEPSPAEESIETTVARETSPAKPVEMPSFEFGVPLSAEEEKALPIGQKAMDEMRQGLGLAENAESDSARHPDIVSFESLDMASRAAHEDYAYTPPAVKATPAPARQPVTARQPEQPISTPFRAPDVPDDMLKGIAWEAIEKSAREILERVAWEVIPDLAERLIREEIERLKAEK